MFLLLFLSIFFNLSVDKYREIDRIVIEKHTYTYYGDNGIGAPRKKNTGTEYYLVLYELYRSSGYGYDYVVIDSFFFWPAKSGLIFKEFIELEDSKYFYLKIKTNHEPWEEEYYKEKREIFVKVKKENLVFKNSYENNLDFQNSKKFPTKFRINLFENLTK